MYARVELRGERRRRTDGTRHRVGPGEERGGERGRKWDQRKRGWISGVVRIASGKINVTQ